VRLVLPKLLRIEALDPREAVFASPAFELVEPRELALRHGHDHLAATLVRDPLLLGETQERLPSRGAQLGLARSGFVIETGVNHAAVVAGLVKGQALFRLEHQAAQPMVHGERARRGEPDDPAAHHDDVEGAHVGRILAHQPPASPQSGTHRRSWARGSAESLSDQGYRVLGTPLRLFKLASILPTELLPENPSNRKLTVLQRARGARRAACGSEDSPKSRSLECSSRSKAA
jgi:hypothetical protein